LDVPEDISVVGYDDTILAGLRAYDLTTIRQPVDKLARMAVELIKELIDVPDAGRSKRVAPATLVVGRTVRGIDKLDQSIAKQISAELDIALEFRGSLMKTKLGAAKVAKREQ